MRLIVFRFDYDFVGICYLFIKIIQKREINVFYQIIVLIPFVKLNIAIYFGIFWCKTLLANEIKEKKQKNVKQQGGFTRFFIHPNP